MVRTVRRMEAAPALSRPVVGLEVLVDDRVSGTLLAGQAGHVTKALDSRRSKGLAAQAFLNFHGNRITRTRARMQL